MFNSNRFILDEPCLTRAELYQITSKYLPEVIKIHRFEWIKNTAYAYIHLVIMDEDGSKTWDFKCRVSAAFLAYSKKELESRLNHPAPFILNWELLA